MCGRSCGGLCDSQEFCCPTTAWRYCIGSRDGYIISAGEIQVIEPHFRQARHEWRAVIFSKGSLAVTRSNRTDHIRLTSHPDPGAKQRFPIHWGASTARERGPIIGTVSQLGLRNVIGTHGGSHPLHRAPAVSSGRPHSLPRPALTNPFPAP